MKSRKARRVWRGWLLLRDGEFYSAVPRRKDADELARVHRPGSKHTWTVRPVTITLMKPKRKL